MAKFPPSALPSGSVVRGYEILRFLGQGACAITYCAEKRSDPGQGLFAIKEFFPSQLVYRGKNGRPRRKSGADPKMLDFLADQFFRESETVSHFQHPHIVRGVEVFEELGTAYLVMRYQTGKSLRQLLRDRHGKFPVNPITIGNLLRNLQDGLEYSHARNCLHCDIKPANIFLGKDYDPVLLDFGAARHSLYESQYGEGDVVQSYTPHYAPYEQCPDGEGKLGPWTDIYQLSAVVYRCLTGGKVPDGSFRIRNPGEFWPLSEYPDLPEGNWPSEFLSGVDWGLEARPESRPRSVGEWRKKMKNSLLQMTKGGDSAERKPGKVELMRKVISHIPPSTNSVDTKTVVASRRSAENFLSNQEKDIEPIGSRLEPKNRHAPFLTVVVGILVVLLLILLGIVMLGG